MYLNVNILIKLVFLWKTYASNKSYVYTIKTKDVKWIKL